MTDCCPLCQATCPAPYHRDRHRAYLRCRVCALVYVPPAQRLPLLEERAVYDLHENRPGDAGYEAFLSRLSEPLLERLPPRQRGLDFGCGPAPVLAQLLRKRGHRVEVFDTYYCDDRSVLAREYDFITATEVLEHLHRPGPELERLWGLLRPGGWLGVMTKLLRDPSAFATWHYIRDPTHVCFFSRDTLRWWARRQLAGIEFIGSDVILLRKPAAAQRLQSPEDSIMPA